MRKIGEKLKMLSVLQTAKTNNIRIGSHNIIDILEMVIVMMMMMC